MITVLSDTHREAGTGLRDRAATAVREATTVVHAGDFTRMPVLEAFRDAAERFVAVYGNNDDGEIRDALPARRVIEDRGVRLAVVHGHEHGETALSLLLRETDADVVVFGHSHRPGVIEVENGYLVNPGSHAENRGHGLAHAELRTVEGRVSGRVVRPDGTVIETFGGDGEGVADGIGDV